MSTVNSKSSETRALILVGGYGTRLRPLTLTRPKLLVEFANKPIVLHQIEALAEAGISHVILAVSCKAEDMEIKLTEEAKKLGVLLTFSHESQPLGTAGPLALARHLLDKSTEPFLVLNSDVICEYPFKELIEHHKKSRKEGTVLVTKVDEPSKYGVVVYKKNGQIEKFIEKPAEFVSNKINAGIYILNPSVLDRIEVRAMSIEKEVFPAMSEEGQLHAMKLQGFWMDIGQPRDFLTGTFLYLESLRRNDSGKLQRYDNHNRYLVEGNVLVDQTAQIGKDCRIGPDVTIAADVIIEDGARLKRSVVLQGAHISRNVWMDSCIVGWHSCVGSWVRLENMTVLGEGVEIQDEVYLNGGQVLPHKRVTQSIYEPQIIM